jgi:hypothetical protein
VGEQENDKSGGHDVFLRSAQAAGREVKAGFPIAQGNCRKFLAERVDFASSVSTFS